MATAKPITVTFPTEHLEFFYLDTINVTYRSDFADPALSCWCGSPWRATQKFRADHVSPFNGSAVVLLNFWSDEPCWFNLTPSSGGCGDSSSPFRLSPNQRALDGAQAIIAGARTSGLESSPPGPLPPRAVALEPRESESKGDSLSPGAKAALGIGIALICIAMGAMCAFLYFRRRRRGQNSELEGAVPDHDRHRGKKGFEKWRKGVSSVASGRSDEPLCPIQPVFDGYPGSMGYDDVRSLHSNTNSHSPSGAYSPTSSHNGGFWTYERSVEREELTAARLKSQLHSGFPAVVSYGPNPVTPTLTPRSSSRLDLNSAAGPVSPESTVAVPQTPMVPISDYTSYGTPPPAAIPAPQPPPPKSPAVPIVVSYGPNKVTPTPPVVSPTVPPDDAIVNRRLMEAASSAPAASRERKFSWEADSPLLGASMGPLPPYASSEEFAAMEKGAVRKLEEPKAEAELPPTKDGFYHYTSDIVEYELPGSAPHNEPLLPFHPYKAHPQAGPSSGGRNGGIDEQKFLLSDVEISRMRAEKAKARAARAEEESYDLGEPVARR
ncbi:hypothetical protein VTK56DRAFT_5167 [Thermocarpiscus australiensis]